MIRFQRLFRSRIAEREHIQSLISIYWVFLVAMMVWAVCLRLWDINARGLWNDELASAVLSAVPVADVLQGTLTRDPHPPLYYMQLHAWITAGSSDIWLRLNSLLWSMLAMVSLFVAVRRILNAEVAILAAALFGLAPFSIYYAQEVRMYAMLMCLSVWVWFFTHQVLHRQYVVRYGIGLILFTEAFLYSHGAAFLLFFSVAGYALAFWLRHPGRWRRLLLWSGFQIIIIMGYVPWLYRAFYIDHLQHISTPELSEILMTVVRAAGFHATIEPFWQGAFVGLLLACGVAFWHWRAEGARETLVFLLMGIVAGVAISHLIRPIWHERILVYLAPFWSISLALAITAGFDLMRLSVTRRRAVAYAGLGSLALLVLLPVSQMSDHRTGAGYRSAAHYVATQAQAGDIVYVPQHFRVYSNWNWYFIGPGSANLASLDYAPRTRNGVTVVTELALEDIEAGTTYWIVRLDRGRANIAPQLDVFPSYNPDETRSFHGLIIEKIQRARGHLAPAQP
jgi:uncharacterized membrane protein